MDKKVLKKEFRNKWRKEKGKGSVIYTVGNVIVFAAAIICFLTLFFDNMGKIQFPIQVIIYIINGLHAIIGMIFCIAGEVGFKKQFKEYLKSKE